MPSGMEAAVVNHSLNFLYLPAPRYLLFAQWLVLVFVQVEHVDFPIRSHR